MAIIDALRSRNMLVDGDIAETAPAEALVAALDEAQDAAFEDVAGSLATRFDLTAFKAEILQAIAETNAENARGRLILFVAMAALIATAVGLILGLN